MSVDSVKQKNISKTLTLWNFFTIGFGAIIGTGWIFLVGEWIIISGGPIPAMLAFLLGALLLLPIGAVFGELTSALPIDGGVIEYVDRTYGKTVSFITGWLLLLSNIIMCPWETIAVSTLFGTLFGDMFPWLRSIRLYSILGADVYLFPVLIALCLSGFIIRQNLHGPKAAAKAQSFLTKALLAGLLLAIISAFDKGSLANWQPLFLPVNESTAHTQATSLWTGIFALLTVTPFFYTGFDTIPQQAEEAAQGLDWHKFGRIISLARGAGRCRWCAAGACCCRRCSVSGPAKQAKRKRPGRRRVVRRSSRPFLLLLSPRCRAVFAVCRRGQILHLTAYRCSGKG